MSVQGLSNQTNTVNKKVELEQCSGFDIEFANDVKKGLAQEQAPRFERVFREQVDGFGPLDYLDFRKLILAQGRKTLSLCLQLLRMSNWDAELFYELSNLIGETSMGAPVQQAAKSDCSFEPLPRPE